MITKIHIENFKCFKEFDIELGPFNVLIGPNDSGKTSLIEAIRIAGFRQHDGSVAIREVVPFGGPNTLWNKDPKARLAITMRPMTDDSIDSSVFREVLYVPASPENVDYLQYATKPDRSIQETDAPNYDAKWRLNWFNRVLGETAYYYFDPSALKKPSPIRKQGGMELTGEGFATYLEEFLRSDRRAFFEMENAFYKKFPHYTSIDILKQGDDNALQFGTRSGQQYPASAISDGTVLYLAYLALSHQPKGIGTLLIEEPENGIHHAALKEVVTTIRKFGEDRNVRVVMTTHSPYLLDLVSPDEVWVFQKDEEGAVHAKRLSDFPDVEDMKKHFMTGEIWTMLDEVKRL